MIVLYIFQTVFAGLSLRAFFGWLGSKHIGLLLCAILEGAGAIASYKLMAWWPLGAAFAATWGVRWLGLDPSAPNRIQPGSREWAKDRLEGMRQERQAEQCNDSQRGQ